MNIHSFNKYVYMLLTSFLIILFLRIVFKIDIFLLLIIFVLLCPLTSYFNNKIKQIKNKKSIIITLIFSFIVSICFIPFYSAPKEKIYINTINREMEKYSENSIEINEIKSGPYSLNFNNINGLSNWTNLNNGLIKTLKNNEKITISVLPNQKLNITYFAKPNNAPVNVTVNGKTKKQYLENSKYRLLTYDYGKVYSTYPMWKQISRIIIFTISFSLINIYLLYIVERIKKLFFILPMTSFFFLQYFLQLDNNNCVILMLTLLFNSFMCVKFFESNYLKKYIANTSKKIWFIIIDFIATFMLIGKSVVLTSGSPINTTLFGVILFILVMFYMGIFIIGTLYVIEYYSKKINRKRKYTNNIGNKKFFLIIFLIIFVSWFIWALVYYPGNMSYDSVLQWMEATTGNISNFHPYWSTLILRNIYLLFGNVFAMTIFQIFTMSLVISGIFTYLYKRGFSFKTLLIIIIILVLLPNLALMNITIWKDIPFTIAFLALSFWCYKVYVQEKENNFKMIDLIILCILLLLASNLRYNAILILYIVSLYFIIFGIIKKNWKYIVTFVLIIIINFVLNKVIINVYNVEMRNLSGLKYSSIIKNFVGTMYFEKDLSKDAHEQIKELNKDEDFITAYSTTNIDNIYFDVANNANNWWPTINNYKSSNIVSLYLENIINNPGVFFRDKLDGMLIMWSIPLPVNDFVYTCYEGIVSSTTKEQLSTIHNQIDNSFVKNEKYLNISNKLKQDYFKKITDITKEDLLMPFFWKSGILMLVLIISMYYAVINNKKEIWALTMPMIAYSLSWCVSLNHPSFRYIYYMYLGSFIILLLIMIDTKEKKKEKIK